MTRSRVLFSGAEPASARVTLPTRSTRYGLCSSSLENSAQFSLIRLGVHCTFTALLLVLTTACRASILCCGLREKGAAGPAPRIRASGWTKVERNIPSLRIHVSPSPPKIFNGKGLS